MLHSSLSEKAADDIEDIEGRIKMYEFWHHSLFFGTLLTLAAYGAGVWLKEKSGSPLLNPLLSAIVITIAFLLIFGIDYDTYYDGAKYVSYLLTPATVCLAVPLYEQLETMKKNITAVAVGVTASVVTSLTVILVMAILFGLDHAGYVTLLPKSITTAIGMGVTEELGGYVSITVAVIIVTGILGNIIAEPVCRIFRIKEPIAKGIAIGSAAHAIGTVKAMEMGAAEGAMSSLAIVAAGILTVFGASIYAMIF